MNMEFNIKQAIINRLRSTNRENIEVVINQGTITLLAQIFEKINSVVFVGYAIFVNFAMIK